MNQAYLRSFFRFVSIFIATFTLSDFSSAETFDVLKQTYEVSPAPLNESAIREIEASIGYTFKNKQLLITAFTTEEADPSNNYEDLEFYGDSILKAYAAPLIMKKCLKPGAYTEARKALESKEPQAALALYLGFYKFIQVVSKELTVDQLEDVSEALIAAMYIDGGEQPALEFVNRFFSPMMMTGFCPKTHNMILSLATKQLGQGFKWNLKPDGAIEISSFVKSRTDQAIDPSFSRKKSRIPSYVAERRFIQSLPHPYPEYLLTLAIDPKYAPLPKDPVVAVSQQFEAVASEGSQLTSKGGPSIALNSNDSISSGNTMLIGQKIQGISWKREFIRDPLQALNELSLKLRIEKKVDCRQDDGDFVCKIELSNRIFEGRALSKKKAERLAANRAYLEVQVKELLSPSLLDHLDELIETFKNIGRDEDENPIVFLNEFIQANNLTKPDTQHFVADSNGQIAFYTRIQAPWLPFPIEGDLAADTTDSKQSAATKVILYLQHVLTRTLSPRAVEEFARFRRLNIPNNEKQYLHALCGALGLSAKYTSKVCEGPINSGIQYQTKLVLSRSENPLFKIKGAPSPSKSEADRLAAELALIKVSNEILRHEIAGL